MNLEMEYNTQRPKMAIPEYGRSVQKMIDFAVTVQDRNERNKIVRSIIVIMEQLAPHLKDLEDFEHKLWTHLYIMSDFKLDVDSPYPKPDPDTFYSRPERVVYPQQHIKYGHYGKTVQLLIQKATALQDGEEKTELTKEIANLMKRNYLTWNRDTVTDDVILQHLKELSGSKLSVDASVLVSSGEILRQKSTVQPTGNGHPGNNNKRKKNKNQYRNKKRF